jgi:DNA-binding transcriptional LysR family regulator
LAAFVEVAHTCSFRQAGQNLYLHSSTVSRHVRQLEVALGALLFKRNTRHVTLTGIGEEALSIAQDVLAGIRQMHAAAKYGELDDGR